MDAEAYEIVEKSEKAKTEIIENPGMAAEATPSRKGAFPKKNSQYRGTGRLPCPDLGEDWMIEQIVRQQGKSAGRFDTYYYSPTGAKIRSKLKLQECVSKSLDGFDYNLGKFVITEEKKDGVEIKQKPNKMKSLKVDELKTIERSPNKTSPKQHRIKGPYAAALKSHKERKNNLYQLKVRKKTKPKESSTSEAIRRAIEIVNKENLDTLPYNMFKKEAMSHAESFPGINFEKLVSCAWGFLSVESKKHFEQSSIYEVANPPIVTKIRRLRPTAHGKTKGAEHPKNCKCFNCYNPIPECVKLRKNIKSPPFVPKRKRCGMCKGCLSSNCGVCSSCKDMKKFGGAGSKKQSCLQRRCEAIHSPTAIGPVSMVPRQSYFSTFSFPQQFTECSSTEKNIEVHSPVQNDDLIWPHFRSNAQPSRLQHMPTSKHDFHMVHRNDMALMNLKSNEIEEFFDDAEEQGVLPQNDDFGGDSFNTNSSGSSNSLEIDVNENSHQTNSHKQQNKRKSRVPVYIKQMSEGEPPDQF